MSEGPNHPSGQPPAGGRGRRRRRGRRGPGAKPGQPGQQQGQPVQSQSQPPQQAQAGPGGGFKGRGQRKRFRSGGKKFGKPQRQSDAQPGVFSAPMDHSYRANGNGDFNGNHNGNGNGSAAPRHFGRQQPPPKVYREPHLEPLAAGQPNDATRIYAFIEDLFFLAKIQETARKLNVKVAFVKTEKEIQEKVEASGEKPSLIIFDLNNHLANPLKTIPKLKKEFKKETNILGFVSHIQGDLKLKAIEAGCDTVVPRSAFSQNLPNLLRRHGAPDEIEEEVQ
jgi:CheY-like chemotaxis protein